MKPTTNGQPAPPLARRPVPSDLSHLHGHAGESPTAVPAESLLVTAREAAQRLAISERTLWGLTDRGELPAVRIGRAVRYDVRDLIAYVDQQKRRT